MKAHPAVIALVSVFGLAGPVAAQTGVPSFRVGQSPQDAAASARTEQAQRFQNGGTTVDGTAQDTGLIPAGIAPSSPGDADLGQQLLLKRQDKATPFSAFSTLSGFYTSNAALTNKATVNDFFFVGEVGLSYQPRITRELVAEITVREADFRYDHYGALDFESLNAGTGLTYTPGFLGGIALSLRYNYNRLTDGKEHRQFFDSQTVTLAAIRSFQLSKAHYIYVGVSSVFAWSDPVALQRDEYGATAGYHLNWSRAVSSELFYRPAYFDYAQGRADWNQMLCFSTKWEITRWFNVTASFSEGFDHSNIPVYSYAVFNPGVIFGGSITF